MNSKAANVLPTDRVLWTKAARAVTARPARRRGRNAAKEYELVRRECRHINASLSDQVDVTAAAVLVCNRDPKRCFEGQQRGHDGFRLSADGATASKRKEDTADIVSPYLNGRELVTSSFLTDPRYIIDFGDGAMLEASAFPKTLAVVQERVLPTWVANAADEK